MDDRAAWSKEQEEQEARRLEGLRTLARIIARHYLEHPQQYPSGTEAGQMTRPASEPRCAEARTQPGSEA